LPDDKGQYDGFIDALIDGDKTEFKEWEGTPYFDGCLPIEVMAERGPRNLAPRPDEADGADQCPQAGRQGLCRGAAAPGQCARHALQHGRLPDEAQIRRAGADFPDDSRARKRRVRAAWRAAPQHLSQFAAAARRQPAAQVAPGTSLRRPDHRLRGLCGKRPPLACLAGRFAAAQAPRRSAVATTVDIRLRSFAKSHHRRAYHQRRRTGQAFVPADERQFRAVPAA
jgi:hypothetical protein